MSVRKLAVALGFVGVLAGTAVLAGASKPKWEVDHKGHLICVSESAVDAHVRHGDLQPTVICKQ